VLGRDYVEDIDIDERIILERILEAVSGCGLDSSGSG
jgi:hypothetical protein